MVAPLVRMLAKSGIKKSDKLLKIRNKRLKEDRASTVQSLPSKQERKLESQLREKGEIPGTKTTIKRGMSFGSFCISPSIVIIISPFASFMPASSAYV